MLVRSINSVIMCYQVEETSCQDTNGTPNINRKNNKRTNQKIQDKNLERLEERHASFNS